MKLLPYTYILSEHLFNQPMFGTNHKSCWVSISKPLGRLEQNFHGLTAHHDASPSYLQNNISYGKFERQLKIFLFRS